MRRRPPASALALLVLGDLLIAARAAQAVRLRRPFAPALAVRYGYDYNHGNAGCSDYNCGGDCYDGHTGSDFPLGLGTDVLAAAEGKVTQVNDGCANYGYFGNTCGGRCGNYVRIAHDDGTVTLYCHMLLGSLRVGVGDHVGCGQPIGRSASSGSSTGPHLHLGWIRGGVTTDAYRGPCTGSPGSWMQQNGYRQAVSDSCECQPSAEVCNGRDDDCDGKVDEDLQRGCGSDVGECSRGTEHCNGGQWQGCTGKPARAEECDGKDNDCNGKTDEDLVRGCGTGVGECTTGTEECIQARWSECSGVRAVPEICDRRDNDCNGATDEAEVCERDELVLQAGALDPGGSTDVDGDGRADACAVGASGVECHLARRGGFRDVVLGPPFAPRPGALPAIALGDLDGDGRADLCVLDGDGLGCYRSQDGRAFGARIEGPPVPAAGAAGEIGLVGTLRLMDVDGDGRADLCLRGAAGLACHRSSLRPRREEGGPGFDEAVVLADLSDAAGFGRTANLATLRMGDLDGDGRADVCARAADGVRCWLSDGRAFSRQVRGPEWSDAAGFAPLPMQATLRLADVDGDGRADLCGRTPEGFACHLSTGDGFGAKVAGPALAEPSWNEPSSYASLRLGDLDGDGRSDLCTRGEAGVSCTRSGGPRGFAEQWLGPSLTDAQGWNAPARYRTLRMADIDGDRRDDLCVRAGDGLRCYTWDGVPLALLVLGPAWSDAAGWDRVERFATIRIAGRGRGMAPEMWLLGGCSAGPVRQEGGPGGFALLFGALLLVVLFHRGRGR